MSTGALIGVIIAVVVLAAAAAVIAQELRRARLRRQFGPEYTRLAKELGGNRKAEAELIARQRRAAKLNIRPLSADQLSRYTRDWTAVQEQFVDGPAAAVQGASGLVERVMRDRGYPAGDQPQLIAALSVHHARKLDHYRKGQGISSRSGSASTEELREAVLSYRELFNDLVGASRTPTGQQPATSPVRRLQLAVKRPRLTVKRPQLTVKRPQLTRTRNSASPDRSR